jgi:hypothetical protein
MLNRNVVSDPDEDRVCGRELETSSEEFLGS